MVLAGILPFGAMFIELFFIFTVSHSVVLMHVVCCVGPVTVHGG